MAVPLKKLFVKIFLTNDGWNRSMLNSSVEMQALSTKKVTPPSVFFSALAECGMQWNNEIGPRKAETADGKMISAQEGRGLSLSGSLLYKEPFLLPGLHQVITIRDFSSPRFLSRFKCHLVSNKIHTWNSVFDLGQVCALPKCLALL